MAIPFFSIDFRWGEWQRFLLALMTGHMHKGDAVETLENLAQERYPSHHATFLPSARMGFDMLLEATLSEGDEVIVPAMGFPLYVSLMLRHGIKPIFVDVEPTHYTIAPDKIENALTGKTQAILVTHLFGHPAHMDAIKDVSDRLGIPIIEDCAQSFDSFYRKDETGTFGHAALVSCSVMKVPTTLGGGLFITKDKELHLRIRSLLDHPAYRFQLMKTARYFVFNCISILNSYPKIYSILSHPAFGIIKWRNPALLRKILYSGLGLDGDFSRWERPKFANYQAAVGIRQFQRTQEMTDKRRRYAAMLDTTLAGTKGLKLPVESVDCRWNYQYYVIHADQPEDLYNKLFSKGIHVMKEDVWDCTRYPFTKAYHRHCPVASQYTPGLIRLQNNSMMREKQIEKIGRLIKELTLEVSPHV